jgi:ABC-2 type transport system permease protein
MKRFLGFVTKEFYHIFRDKTLDVHPLDAHRSNHVVRFYEINNVNIAILDKSKDTETEIIINKISASQYFHIKQTISTESEIESIFKRKGKSSIGFENHFENLQTQKKEKYK